MISGASENIVNPGEISATFLACSLQVGEREEPSKGPLSLYQAGSFIWSVVSDRINGFRKHFLAVTESGTMQR